MLTPSKTSTDCSHVAIADSDQCPEAIFIKTGVDTDKESTPKWERLLENVINLRSSLVTNFDMQII